MFTPKEENENPSLDNQELSDLKEGSRDGVNAILGEESNNNPNKKFVEKQYPEFFKGYSGNILKYTAILEEKGIKNKKLDS